MTAMRAFLLGALLALLMVPCVPAQAQDREFDIDIFYEELEPYGDWFEHPRWGLVWSPNVERDWRPYSRGYWTYTDEYGWYWESEEPFGWAVFHYGRWIFDEDDGWIWIPDTEWGPAWVIWRWGDDHVGWAPMAPGSRWSSGGDLDYDEAFYDGPAYFIAWSFVHPRYLTTPGLYRYFAPRAQYAFILRRTRHVHGYRRLGRRVVNVGIDVRRFERTIGRPVERMRLRSVDNPRELRSRRDRGEREVQVFMPRIIQRPDGARRPPQLKERPARKDTRPSFTGFPKDQSKVLQRKEGPSAPSPGFVAPPPGDQRLRSRQTTTPPPTDDKGPPPDASRQRFKQTTTPPPDATQGQPRTFTQPPRGPSGPGATERQGGRTQPGPTVGGGQPTGRTPQATDKVKKEGKKDGKEETPR
jgi:hypothetical protein